MAEDGAPLRSDRDGFAVANIPFADTVSAAAADEAMGPLIFNAWYVIAEAAEVDRTLRSIKVCGEPLVYYRTEAGRPVVLDDRCPHRRYPLSKSRLVGDTVECGYHGFTYEPSGRCVWAPGLPLERKEGAKLAFGVRAYPCAEKASWLWVWMGDPALADPAKIPAPDLPGFDARAAIRGYKPMQGNYMMLVENQLDLSHVTFLHRAENLEYTLEPPVEAAMPAGEEGVAYSKVLERVGAGGFCAACGEDPERPVRTEEYMAMFAPSFAYGHQWRKAHDGLPLKGSQVVVFHAFTPEDERNTHQFTWLAFSDPFVVPQADYEHVVKDVVFEQDAQAVRDMQAFVDEDRRPGRVEFSMGWDRLGLKMRRVVREAKARELPTA